MDPGFRRGDVRGDGKRADPKGRGDGRCAGPSPPASFRRKPESIARTFPLGPAVQLAATQQWTPAFAGVTFEEMANGRAQKDAAKVVVPNHPPPTSFRRKPESLARNEPRSERRWSVRCTDHSERLTSSPVIPGERPPGRAEGPPEGRLRREGRGPSNRRRGRTSPAGVPWMPAPAGMTGGVSGARPATMEFALKQPHPRHSGESRNPLRRRFHWLRRCNWPRRSNGPRLSPG